MCGESNVQQVEDSILNFIMSDLSADSKQRIDKSEDLLKLGVLDSLAIVLLTEFISSEFSLEIDADDVTPDNFESISAIAALVSSKMSH